MTNRTWGMSMLKVQTLPLVDSIAERRALVAHEEELLQAERQQQIAAQRSGLSSPEERIQMWERLHGLDLPRGHDHKLLVLIAEQTGLPLASLHDEQQRRAQSAS